MADRKLLQKVFDKLDLDGNGVLTLDEVSEGMHKLGFPINQQDIQKAVFEAIDIDNSGTITFQEFERYVQQRNQEFYEVFTNIAKSHSQDYEIDPNFEDVLLIQTITTNDIRYFLSKYKIKATDQQINSFLSLLDEHSEGFISFQEFQAFFALLPKANAAAVFETFKHTQMYEHAHDEMRIPRQLISDKNDNRQYLKLLSGAIAGFVSRTVTAPIDRLRMMMQFKHPGSEKLQFWGGLRQIYQEDGVKGYFKGNGINCMKKVPEIAIKFTIFDFLLKEFSSKNHTTSNFEKIFSGGIAGGIGQFLVYPIEIARVRFALAPNNYYSGLFNCIYTIARQEGITKLYAGLTPTLIGIFPYSGIDIGVYSIIKMQYCKKFQGQDQEPSIPNLLVSGMVASAFAMVFTAPINIIRTRLQSNGLNPVSKRYKGPLDVFQRTMRKEGVKGFYRGTLPALIKVMPATSISYIVYEKINTLFKLNNTA